MKNNLKQQIHLHNMKNLTEQNIAELRQAQEILNRVLPLMEPKEVEYKPFPKNYVIKKGTEVVVVDNRYSVTKKGSIGIAEESSVEPWFKFNGIEDTWSVLSHNVAPLNPEEHPEHPNFKLSAGDYVKITWKGVHNGKILKLSEDNLDSDEIGNRSHFLYDDGLYCLPGEASFCTDAEIAEFEESLKPKPISRGTLCLVSDYVNHLITRYSDGKGSFYYDGKSGNTCTWKHAIPFTPEMQQIVEDYITNN